MVRTVLIGDPKNKLTMVAYIVSDSGCDDAVAAAISSILLF